MGEQAVNETKSFSTVVGKVVSNKMDKTIVVLVEDQIQHSKYKKYRKRNAKFYAHDENNQCKEGDIVRIRQSRPLSKTKSWRLLEIISSTE